MTDTIANGLVESLKARLASRYNRNGNTIPVSRTEVERIIAAILASMPPAGRVEELREALFEIHAIIEDSVLEQNYRIRDIIANALSGEVR